MASLPFSASLTPWLLTTPSVNHGPLAHAAMDDYCPFLPIRRPLRCADSGDCWPGCSAARTHMAPPQPAATLEQPATGPTGQARPPCAGKARPRLDQIYATKAGNAPAPGVIGILVGQPFCGHADIPTHWAVGGLARLLAPPTAQEILAADVQWLTRCCDSGPGLWALPALERCYLRNANGLALVRGFLDLAFSGAPARASSAATAGPGPISSASAHGLPRRC